MQVWKTIVSMQHYTDRTRVDTTSVSFGGLGSQGQERAKHLLQLKYNQNRISDHGFPHF